MKVEVLQTLKGSILWRRGTVFDDAVSPIPKEILLEVKNNADTVKVIAASPFAKAEKPFAEAEIANEIEKPVEEKPWPEIVEKATVSPPQETTSTNPLPKLERIIKEYPSMSAVADLLNVTPMTISRWRNKKSAPKPGALRLIDKEYQRITADDQG